MAALTAYLQREFEQQCPDGWVCRPESALLPRDLASILGYSPRVDLVLERRDHIRRLWIEFEISRADPVANHAKFATAHLFQPQLPTDAFVAMVSPHVSRGRRNLAANTVWLMRHIGMNAFQTVLLPSLVPEQVKRLNHLDLEALTKEQLPVAPEIERVLLVSEPVLTAQGRRIHFAADLLEVMLNIRQWNQEVATPGAQAVWGRRRVTYFVCDPRSGQFAPSKFCAYVPIPAPAASGSPPTPFTRAEMTVDLYVTLDGTEKRFDGAKARTHLTRHLGMLPRTPDQVPEVTRRFADWLGRHKSSIAVHPDGPVFVLPPEWFK